MDEPRLNLLDEPLIRIRDLDGALQRLSLPQLFVELGRDAVRDFPALRPHQRHPWHALLVQLAALALHEAGETKAWDDPADWRTALLALTPDHPDGCAFSLLAPHDQPAFLQAPVPGGKLDGWKDIATPDALDMLVTSKNHDLKGERMRRAEADDWLFALVSLQTQEGVLGNGKRGISRMNSGYGNRPAVGVAPPGGAGARWRRDLQVILDARSGIAGDFGLREADGISLLWVTPWDGTTSLRFADLDPLYIEICRRVRLASGVGSYIRAYDSTSKVNRVGVGESQKGKTGDPWAPINLEEDKALNLPAGGFDHSLCVDILWGGKFRRTVSQTLRPDDSATGNSFLAQGLVRGNGKTEGYHERRIPLSQKSVGWMKSGQTDLLAKIAKARVEDVAKMRGSVLRTALFHLIEAGTEKIDFDRRTAKQQIEPFVQAFERDEDAHFFDDLNREIESDDPHAERLAWLLGLAGRAEAVLRRAFAIGPQCGERRYRARARALTYFHNALRSGKHFPALALHLREQSAAEEAAS
ncbi:type I-E CRISPR-associated protein Cse1/CasA [Thauera aromatica]|uniref:type I-E CRISPR-associated protein Cse1/CasA n=1 Tax=Thauera aromatica TaxID=59405 RepID=UPI001FFD771F|nr:type I-E CRISPR-associated protein Cse1/CasA [Thauera aromatica]MCK2089333.1 type I-E CRISPR-associated protein Cse1/CasA [Thauera aromatica]